ncbi:MAG TPA: efflux RND transporter periplasmic adaptor subunit [Oculatellaceae cyanobacterium]
MDSPSAQRAEEQELKYNGKRAAAGKKSPLLPVTLVILCIVAIAGLTIYGGLPRYIQKKELNEHSREQLAQATPVSVVEAQPGAAIQEFTLPGATQPIQDAPIYARVDGYLAKRYVNIGDKVKTGQLLAEIDTPELDQQVQAAASSAEQAGANLDNAREAYEKSQADAKTAAANVQKAKTDLQFYTRELVRYKQLVQQGAVSQEDTDTRTQAFNSGQATLDAMEAAERSAKASVNSARAAVHVAQAALDAANAQHDQYAAMRSFRKVTALFDGIVTKRNVDAGALISAGSNSSNNLLFEIAKTDVLRVFVYVPEQYVSFIALNEHAKLSFQEYPTREFDGVVSNVSGGIDPASKTLQVEIHVPNADHKLLPGMYAKVRFQAPSKIRLPIVPATTLQTRADGLFMYTVDQDNKIHMHKVSVARDLGGQFEIANGINSGDKVIVNPSDELREGQSCSPVVMPSAVAKSEGK